MTMFMSKADVAAELEKRIRAYVVEQGKVMLVPGTYFQVEKSANGGPEVVCRACALGMLALECGAQTLVNPAALGYSAIRSVLVKTLSALSIKNRDLDHLEAGFEGRTYGWTSVRIDNDHPFYKLGERLRSQP